MTLFSLDSNGSLFFSLPVFLCPIQYFIGRNVHQDLIFSSERLFKVTHS